MDLVSYAELRNADGALVTSVAQSSTAAVPELDDTLTGTNPSRIWTTGSASGSGKWRVYAGPADGYTGYSVVVAVPLTEVTSERTRSPGRCSSLDSA